MLKRFCDRCETDMGNFSGLFKERSTWRLEVSCFKGNVRRDLCRECIADIVAGKKEPKKNEIPSRPKSQA